MLRRSILICPLLAAPLLVTAHAQQRKPPANSTVRAPLKNGAEAVFASAASKVVFLVTRKSGELHARASGVILTADGYIATNYHALAGADEAEIRFFPDPEDSANYQSFNGAKLLYADAERDIAVLKVTSKSLRFLECPPTTGCKPLVGETVHAIGNPRGLTNTISEGIVSALRTGGAEDFIQHTAPISPGSSGGALVDSHGNPLGMNSWQVADAQNLNFAISAKQLLEALAVARHTTAALSFPPEAFAEAASPEDRPSQAAPGQDDAAKQKAISEMRRIANTIKQCPEEVSYQNECKVHYVGPPINVEWDVLPSKSVRSPFQGIVEFNLGERESDPANQSKAIHQKCVDMEYNIAMLGAPALAEAMKRGPIKVRHYHYRYEFDLGSDAPELVKMLLVEDETKETVAASRGEHTCWVKAARSIKPWNSTAIRAEFVELATSHEKGTINFWYTLTNTTDTDYRIDRLDEVTTAGWTEGDSLYAFNQGISFEVPLIIAAHRKIEAMFHFLPAIPFHLRVPDDASDTAVATYKTNLMNFLRSEYAHLKGFAVLDERTRYEIDFPLPDASGGGDKKLRTPPQTEP